MHSCVSGQNWSMWQFGHQPLAAAVFCGVSVQSALDYFNSLCRVRLVRVFRTMLKYAAVEDQPVQGRTRNQLMDDERPIFDKFTDCQFVETLIKLLSLEENKGKDRFHAKHFTLFKVHFRLICLFSRPSDNLKVDVLDMLLVCPSDVLDVTGLNPMHAACWHLCQVNLHCTFLSSSNSLLICRS